MTSIILHAHSTFEHAATYSLPIYDYKILWSNEESWRAKYDFYIISIEVEDICTHSLLSNEF